MKYRNLIISTGSFVLSFIVGRYFDLQFITENQAGIAIDEYVSAQTNYALLGSITYVAIVIYFLLIAALLIMSMVYAYKSLKETEVATKTSRLAGLVLFTVSSFSLFTFVTVNIYLFAIG
ncbi:MAG: hypothetical protein V4668_01990 [Patescibacteria group bacterium]